VPPITEHILAETSRLMEDHRGMFRKQGSLFADVVLPESQANNITGIDIVLQKAAVITGRVIDSQGNIVPGPRPKAWVRLVPVDSRDDKNEPLLVQIPETTGLDWIALDELGGFRIDRVPTGSYLFKVDAERHRHRKATNEPLTVSAGQVVRDIEVIVPTEGPSEIEVPPASEDNSVVTSAPVTYLPDSQKPRQRITDEVRYEGRTIEQWVSRFDSESYDDRREAIGALTQVGRPVVPAMIEQMKKGGMGASCARGVLEKMGPEAEDAVPWLIGVALDKEVPISKEWESKASYREGVVSCLYSMTWARDRVVPVLQRIAGDNEDNTRLRRVAILFLRDVGKQAIPILRNLTETLEGEVQNAAHHMLAQLLEREEGLSKEDYYTPLIEKDPFGASVPEYLAVMKSPGNLGRPNPLTQKIKRLYRQRLEEEPDAHLAWQLASVIQYGLRNTELTWAAPTDGSIVRWSREDPTESFATLAQVLRLAFDRAESGSQLWRQFGISLAKLRLLQGDWDRMNAMLKELGQGPIPKESRRWLPAPPADWRENLSSRWVAADESMRSGDCSLEFKIEKDGKGLKGAHFLVKRAPEPTNVFQTGISIDTLFFQPYPFSFGYRAEDRPMTRYAVSDESGIVHFDRLPEIPIKIEVLVPTSNFVEVQSDWELWMEVEPGKFKIAKVYGTPEEVVDVRKPPAVVELEDGQTVYYPRLIVRPAVANK
jgi:hypothetical protein